MKRNGARTTPADCAGRVESAENPAASGEPIGLLIASARSRLKQAVLTRAAAHGLAVQQFWFLIALREAPGVSQVELADRVRSDAPTTSRVISSLMRRRLVRRRFPAVCVDSQDIEIVFGTRFIHPLQVFEIAHRVSRIGRSERRRERRRHALDRFRAFFAGYCQTTGERPTPMGSAFPLPPAPLLRIQSGA